MNSDAGAAAAGVHDFDAIVVLVAGQEDGCRPGAGWRRTLDAGGVAPGFPARKVRAVDAHGRGRGRLVRVQRPDDFALLVGDADAEVLRHGDGDCRQVTAWLELHRTLHLPLVGVERLPVGVVGVVNQDLVAIETDGGDVVARHFEDDGSPGLQFGTDLFVRADAEAGEPQCRAARPGLCDLPGEFVRGGPDDVPIDVATAHPATACFPRVTVKPLVHGLWRELRTVRHRQDVEDSHDRGHRSHRTATLLDGGPAPVGAEFRVIGFGVGVFRPGRVVLREEGGACGAGRQWLHLRERFVALLLRLVAHVDARVGSLGVPRGHCRGLRRPRDPGWDLVAVDPRNPEGQGEGGKKQDEGDRPLPALQRWMDKQLARRFHRVRAAHSGRSDDAVRLNCRPAK